MESLAISTLYVATFVNAAMPGPCAVLAASRTARYGVRSGWIVSWGVVAGAAVVTAIAFATMLGVLALSHNMLQVMKWAGVLALLVLAARTLFPAVLPGTNGLRRRSAGNDFCSGAIVVVSSPSVLVFLLALLPQFVQSSASDVRPALIAGMVFVSGVAAAQVAAILLGACSLRIDGAPSRWVELAGAALLVGFACAAIFTPIGQAASYAADVSERGFIEAIEVTR